MTTNEKLMLTALEDIVSRIDKARKDSTWPVAHIQVIANVAIKQVTGE